MFQVRWAFVTLLILLQRNWLAEARAPVITRQPSSTYATKGGIAELDCEATGDDPLKYKWFHNGQRVQSNDRRRVLINGHLYIKRVLHKKRKRISDTGRYYCSVTDRNGKVTKSRVVNITLGHIRKDFRISPVTQSISRGNELVLTCSPPRGKPKPKVRWLKDDRNLDVDGIRIFLEERKQKLIIKKFKKEDEGDYKCEATNVAGRRLSNPATITSTVPPSIVTRSKTVDLSIQTQVTLSCKAGGVPTPVIFWKKEGNNTILPSSDGKLLLTNLKPRDKGKYICIAHNSEGNATATADLMLLYIPEFAILSQNVNQIEGSTVKLKCLANSEPYPTIYWRKSTETVRYAIDHTYGHIRTKRDDRTIYLIFEPLKLSDGGNYTCEATNSIGTSKRDVKVAVYRKSEYPPSIFTPHVKISADINGNITIICDVDGNPKPGVEWLKIGEDGGLNDGVMLKNEPLQGKKHRYSLVISKVQLSNAGTFQCMAGNVIKVVSKEIVLQVSRKLRLSQALSSGVPSMPKNVRVVEYNDKSVHIAWDHSNDPVLVYAVGYINVDERSNEQYAAVDVDPNAGQYVIKGLKPNTRYMFFVRGINETGRGVPSLLSDVVRTQTAAPTRPILVSSTRSKPEPKLKVSLSSAGPGQLDVRWEKLNIDDKIDGFYIYWKVKGWKTDFRKETLQNSESTRYIISDLQSSTKYSVRVQVFKNELKGPMSKVVHHRTSYKPVRLMMSVTLNDSDSMTVTWKRLWKKNSGADTLKTYYIWFTSSSKERRRKRESQSAAVQISASAEKYRYIIGNLNPGGSYNVWMTVKTALGRQYKSAQETITLPTPGTVATKKSTMHKIKDFIIQPWFLGVLGGFILILILILLLCCLCKRSSSKKDGDNLSIQLQERNQPETVRRASEGPSTETDVLTPPSRTRESLSECADSYDGRSSSAVYRCSGSPRTPTRSNLDFPNIAITPHKYERMYRSLEARDNDNVNSGRQARKYSENDFDISPRYNQRSRNAYSPAPRPSFLNVDNQSDYDNAKSKCESTPEPAARSPTHSPYPGEAPPDYETAIAENSQHEDNDRENKTVRDKDSRIGPMDGMRYKRDRFGNLSSRQSSCSPGSECSNQGSSIAGRRKGLKPPPRLTIASVNWADMLPPPPSHPPPSSVATRSPPPSPTGTSMCSETTYGRSHASSFLPRRSGSVVSADMASDLEKETADSVRSGKSKGKSENKLPFDLAGITSDIIMQWADSVTNTSGSEDESPCSSPDRRSGISSDGSFLTDTDFANAVKAAAECGGFNIDIDLNMYKAMDPISFQPFAGSLSTYNPETSSSIKPPSKKVVNAPRDGDGLRDSSRGRRAKCEISRDTTGNLPSVKENSPYVSSSETKNNRKPRSASETPNNGSIGYVPALTRTSALGKLEPVNRGAVKKKYAVVRTLPQVQTEDSPDYTPNYPSHSLSSSTSNASTIRSSSCPPLMLTDDDTEDDII